MSILIIIIFLIMVTVILFAPQILATALNLIIQGVEILAMLIMIIPAAILYLIVFIVWILLLALDVGLEYVHDITIGQLEKWISLGSYDPWTTDDVPDISYAAYNILLQIRGWIAQKPYFGRVEVPKTSFAQQLVDMIAAMGVPQPFAYIVLYAFIALVIFFGLFLAVRMR